jgi:anti-sigma-K factor RskA
VTVLADGVPAPGPGRTYQLWLITDDGATHSAGVFAPDTGDATTSTRLGPPTGVDPGRLTALAVTQDRPGGAPAPTGEVRYQAPW